MSDVASNSNNGGSPLTKRPSVRRSLSGSLSRRQGSGSPNNSMSSPRLGLDPSAGDIPESVRKMKELPASQRIKMEWDIKQKQLRADLDKKAVRNSRAKSPQISRRNEIDMEVSQRRASRLANVESSPKSDFDTPVQEDSSIWARNRQERFTYQYGNFEGAVPDYVPTKQMLRRSPAVGTYGKSTSVNA